MPPDDLFADLCRAACCPDGCMLAPGPCRAIFRRTRNVLALLRRLPRHDWLDHLIAEGERRG